jgi:hypothetical protein
MIAETAQVLVDIKATESISAATNKAIASTERLNTSAVGFGSRFDAGLKKAGSGISKLESGLSSMGGHLKDVITGPLGMLGLGAGLFSLGAAFEKSVGTAADFGLEVQKLQGVTGLSVDKVSALAAALDHFHIEGDSAVKVIGMMQKNIGNLAVTGKAADFTAKYGLSLKNTSITAAQLSAALTTLKDKTAAHADKVKAANIILAYNKAAFQAADQQLLTTADYFNNKLIPANEKAAALQKIYGRSWQTLIPLLQAGSKGILEAEAAAKDLGLTLTAQNATDLKNYRENFLNLGDAIKGLQLQIGLVLIPMVSDLAKGITNFLREGGTQRIVGLFHQLGDAARNVAGVITDTVIPTISGFATVAKNIYDSIPAPIRDLLIQGFIADRTIKFLFGVSPIHLVTEFAEGALSKIGGSIAGAIVGNVFNKAVPMPVFVTNWAMMGGGGGLPGAVGGAAEGAAGVGLGVLAATVAALIATPVVIAGVSLAISKATGADVRGLGGQADTSRRRGVPDAQNKPLQQLVELAKQGNKDAIDYLHQHGIDISADGIEAIRGAISAGLHPPKPSGLGKGKGSVADMESNRGGMADALQRDMGHLVQQFGKGLPKNLAKTQDIEHLRASFKPSVAAAVGPDIEKLRGSIAAGLTKTSSTVGGDIESMRGRIAAGLSGVRAAVDRKKLSANTKVTTSVKNQTTVTVSAAAVSKAQYKTTINQSASYMNTLGNLTGDSSPMAGK